MLSLTLEHPPSCYTGVEAFDIESDGSVGSLAISGQLKVHSQAPCSSPLSGSNVCCNYLQGFIQTMGSTGISLPRSTGTRLISPPEETAIIDNNFCH